MAPSLGVNLRVTGHCNQVIITSLQQILQLQVLEKPLIVITFQLSRLINDYFKKSPVIVILRLM